MNRDELITFIRSLTPEQADKIVKKLEQLKEQLAKDGGAKE